MKKITTILFLVVTLFTATAQTNIGIGTNSPAASAKLDVSSTAQG